MRIGPYAFVALLAASTGAAVGACSGEVSTETNSAGSSTGNGGSGGHGGTGGSGATSTASSSSSSSSSTGPSSSSLSTGGGDICMQACDHVQTCTGFSCNQLGITIDCSNPQYQCIAQCVNNVPCGMGFIQQAQGCFQMCQPDGGTGSDGGDACTQACDHAQACYGIDVCTQLGIMLDCSDPQQECAAQCAANTPCDQLNQGTLQACQMQCQGDGGVGGSDGGMGGSDGGGNVQQCQQCLLALNGCGTELFACQNDQACTNGWGACALDCNQNNPTPQCYSSCDAQFPNQAQFYGPIYTCACSKCSNECGSTIDPCNH